MSNFEQKSEEQMSERANSQPCNMSIRTCFSFSGGSLRAGGCCLGLPLSQAQGPSGLCIPYWRLPPWSPHSPSLCPHFTLWTPWASLWDSPLCLAGLPFASIGLPELPCGLPERRPLCVFIDSLGPVAPPWLSLSLSLSLSFSLASMGF